MAEITKYHQAPQAVAIRRELVQKKEVIESLTMIERAIFIASTQKTIREYESVELATELTKIIKLITKDIGIRIATEDLRYNIVRVAEMLRNYYDDITLSDFSLAFELSLTGELNFYLPKGRDGQALTSHFQSFNVEYVCRILNAYKQYRSNAIKKAHDAVLREPVINIEREKAFRNMTKKDVVRAYLSYKYRGDIPDMSGIDEMLVLDFLDKNDLAKHVVLSVDESRELLCASLKQTKEKYSMFRRARRKALEQAFERMMEDEISINDFIVYEN